LTRTVAAVRVAEPRDLAADLKVMVFPLVVGSHYNPCFFREVPPGKN
jgi:hypothetical protein